MGANPETVHATKLLVLAAGCRERANGATNPYQADVLRRAAEDLERAAARATNPLALSRLTPGTLPTRPSPVRSPGLSRLSRGQMPE
jgi:hypothetical protein